MAIEMTSKGKISKEMKIKLVGIEFVDTHEATIRALIHFQEIKDTLIMLSKSNIALTDEESLRSRHANNFLAWFNPAWEMLSEKEQLILTEYYMSGNLKSNAGARLENSDRDDMQICLRQINRHKVDALSKLSMLLYGASRSYRKRRNKR